MFSALQRLISLRRQLPVLADFNNRVLLANDNPHVFTLVRTPYAAGQQPVVVAANFEARSHHLNLDALRTARSPAGPAAHDLYSGQAVPLQQEFAGNTGLRVCYWLVEHMK
ncbi:MAG: DUF3459 domain-containing protein [Thiolinea sp.]